VTKGAGATMHVDLVVWEVKIVHRRHGDHREGFIDFEQIDAVTVPAGFGEQCFDRTDWRRCEVGRSACMRGVTDDACAWREAAFGGLRQAHQQQCRRAI